MLSNSRNEAILIQEGANRYAEQTLKELEQLFPMHFTGEDKAKLRKYKVVKTPLSVYKATPGCQKIRPSQNTPIKNFFLTGDYTMQRYLASMEGAVLSGKLCADAVNKQSKNLSQLQCKNTVLPE